MCVRGPASIYPQLYIYICDWPRPLSGQEQTKQADSAWRLKSRNILNKSQAEGSRTPTLENFRQNHLKILCALTLTYDKESVRGNPAREGAAGGRRLEGFPKGGEAAAKTSSHFGQTNKPRCRLRLQSLSEMVAVQAEKMYANF